ncbi:MAG: DUF2797 domain-containing protein [Thermoplasmata archaeon]
MFKKANTLLQDRQKIFDEREVHVVSYRWNEFNPALLVYDGGELEDFDLGKIDINVSQRKICVGRFEDGYDPCPKKAAVSTFDQCRDCAPDYIPKLECIFEPGDCDNCGERGFCEEEHAVYLAFHGEHMKIGMTRKKRLKRRLIEQGADAYALLATLENRKDAREEEKNLSKMLNISQRIGKKKKLKTLARKLPKDGIYTSYRGVKNRVPVGKLKFLNDYPISLPLRAVPRLRATPGVHKGKMVGIKGSFLIYENNGLQALNLSDLVGRKMKVRK